MAVAAGKNTSRGDRKIKTKPGQRADENDGMASAEPEHKKTTSKKQRRSKANATSSPKGRAKSTARPERSSSNLPKPTTIKKPVLAEDPATSQAVRALERENKELRVRLREFELKETRGPVEDAIPDPDTKLSEEGARILTIMSGLGDDLETALKANEALNADAAGMAQALESESRARARAVSERTYLEARVAEDDYLRDEIRFVEEERDDVARRLDRTMGRLDETTKERDTLTARLHEAEEALAASRDEAPARRARIAYLEAKVAEMDGIRLKLVEAEEMRRASREAAEDLSERLAAAETCKEALALDLTTTREVTRTVRAETEELHAALEAARRDLAELKAKVVVQESENRKLTHERKRAECARAVLEAKHVAALRELRSHQKALAHVRTATADAYGRIRDRVGSAGREEPLDRSMLRQPPAPDPEGLYEPEQPRPDVDIDEKRDEREKRDIA